MEVDTEAVRRLRDHLLSRPDGPREERPRAGADVVSAVLRRVEPFAETLFLVMSADGDVSPVERDAMVGALDVLTDGCLASSDVAGLLERFAANLAADGTEGRLARIGAWISRDRDDRETAFALAAVMAMADGRVDVRENRALHWVQEYYGISDRRVTAILESLD